MLMWGGEVIGVPTVVVEDRVCLVANQFRDTSHSNGHGFPPKLNLSIIRRMLISTSWVQICAADAALRWHRRKTDLKSNLDARIGLLGNFRQAEMVQLTILLMHVPNMHGRSSSVITRPLMDEASAAK